MALFAGADQETIIFATEWSNTTLLSIPGIEHEFGAIRTSSNGDGAALTEEECSSRRLPLLTGA